MILTDEELEFKVDTRIKQIEKRSVGNPHDKHRTTQLSIEPTQMNFKGSDREEPVVCSYFGCNTHLTETEILCGTRCLNHQNKKRTDPNLVLSYPMKKVV